MITTTMPAAPPSPVIVVDTREQLPWPFSGLATVGGTLATGDYSIAGLEHLVAVERKSLPDLLGCVGKDRKRFERELQRLRAYYPHRMLVVEASWEEIELGQWRSRLVPAHVTGSLLGWMSGGIPVLLAGDRDRAAVLVENWLRIVHRRRWRELRAMLQKPGT